MFACSCCWDWCWRRWDQARTAQKRLSSESIFTEHIYLALHQYIERLKAGLSFCIPDWKSTEDFALNPSRGSRLQMRETTLTCPGPQLESVLRTRPALGLDSLHCVLCHFSSIMGLKWTLNLYCCCSLSSSLLQACLLWQLYRELISCYTYCFINRVLQTWTIQFI